MNRFLKISIAIAAVLAAAHLWIAPSPCPAQQKSNRIVEMLRRLDRNNDGQVAPDEVPGSIQPIVARIAERMKLDPSNPIAIEAVERSLSGGSGGPSSSTDKKKSDFESSSPSSGGGGSPQLVPGFGVPDDRKPVAGFDVPLNYVPPEERFSSNVIRYVEQIMERYDRDRNDVLDAEEIKRGRWYGDPKSSDLDGDGKLSKVEMYERVAKRWSSQRGSSGGSSRTSSASANDTDAADRNREYAKSYLRQFDTNNNGVIDRDEWGKMKGDPEKDDLNKDGHLTVDEIVVRLENYSKGKSSGGSSSTYSSPTRSSSSRSYIGRRPTDGDTNYYRALSPIERLPRGLPDWFARNDANGDGQIGMSEFATAWNDAKAAEFTSLDTNRDGVITPAECLEAKKSAEKK